MNSIKHFLTYIDIFGITLAFKYEKRIKFQTPFGGFFLVLFIILLFSFVIYHFIPFMDRKNYTIVYYTMNLASTEEVNLFASESNVAFGLTCEDNDKEKLKIEDLLDLQSKYIIYKKTMDGKYEKDPVDLNTHSCSYEDFCYKYDKAVDYLGLQRFKCMKDKDYLIQGIYADQVFSYFEFSVLAKNTSDILLNEIERFLFENDCKFHIVYTDIIIDLDNYKNPITQYLNDEIFIQLNPTLFIKKNIFFMNQDFTNDDYLLFIIADDETLETKTLYSRYEEYSLYKGLNRTLTKSDYYNYYSKVYIRADLKKTVIKRRYQKFMEFFADASSLLMAIYEVLNIIFYFIYNFVAYHFLSKKIFFFREFDNENNFKILNKINRIQNLIYITDLSEKHSEINSSEVKSRDSKVRKISRNDPINIEKIKYKEENKKEINIYNNQGKSLDIKQLKYSSYLKQNEINTNKRNYIKDSNYLIQYEGISKNKMTKNFHKYSMNIMRINKNKDEIPNLKCSDREKIFFDESFGKNSEYSSSESEMPKKKKRVEFSFNICEIMVIMLFRCCMTKKLSIKNDINEKTNDIMFKKLDIANYVRNMILFDLINQIVINDNKKQIINFLCRPIISSDKKEKDKFEELYKNYREKDFNKFSEQIIELVNNPQKNEKQTKLISLSHNHLSSFL